VTFPNLVSTARNLRGPQRAFVVALLLLASAVFAWLASTQLPGETNVSLWYPASGINVVAAVAVVRKRRWIVILLVALLTAPVLFSAGRPLVVVVVGALTVAAEAWIVTQFVVDKHDQPRLTTTTDVVRFFIGALLGTSLTAVLAGGTVSLASHSNFAATALSIMASHASAIVVIAPIALVNRMKKAKGRTTTRIVHAILTVAAVFVAFFPGSIPQLAFLPIPFLAWAAFSFSMSFVLIELIVVSAEAVVFTTIGGGPFAHVAASIVFGPAGLLELYVITLSVTALLIAAARNERQILEEQKGAAAQLLHQAFEQSHNGFAIVQEHDGQFNVMEINSAAIALMPLSMTPAGTLIEGSPVHEVLAHLIEDGGCRATLVNEDDASGIPATLTVTVVSNSTFGEILLLSVEDLRDIRAARAAAQLQLEREQLVIEELRQLNQQKDDFVSSVTHELRTPITAVIGFSEELDDTPLDSEQKNYVTIIQRNAERLLSVVEDVLTFSRRTPGAVEVDSAVEVDVIEAIVLVVDDLRHSIREKSIAVTLDLPDQPVIVIADPNNLTRVIINILTNAIKFTPTDGALAISASVTADNVEIVITDNGPGVATSDLDKVFDRFYRASQATHDGVPGTGLGLSIVRDLVTAMAGTVVLESDGHSGTTARIVLPVASVSALR
jgi:two-component system, OmpR family, phosphate regulon sensor histidine kinase PhoR